MKKSSLVLLLLLSACGFETVEEGYRGIYTRLGKMEGEPLGPGFHVYNPFTGDIFEMDVREHLMEGKLPCFTSDTQSVVVDATLAFYPKQDKIGVLYAQFGKDWENKIVSPMLQTAVKDVIGQFRADDLVSKREAARQQAFKEIETALAARNVVATRLDFTNLDFRDEYEHAVEAKVVAVQRAAEAKNKTVQVKEEAEQKVLAATADAKAMQIKSQALSQNKGLVQYEAVQKWDGKLPVNMFGNAMPILNLEALKRAE